MQRLRLGGLTSGLAEASGSRPESKGAAAHGTRWERSPADTVGAPDRFHLELHPETTRGRTQDWPGHGLSTCSLLTSETAPEAQQVKSHQGTGVIQGQVDNKNKKDASTWAQCALSELIL